MTYEEIIQRVVDGVRFSIDFKSRTLRIDGKPVDLSDMEIPYPNMPVMTKIELLYIHYKRSVPSERSESHRRHYFRAKPERELTDQDMMYGEEREPMRCRLELYVLLAISHGHLTWHEEWGSWFWQSQQDKDLVILREWIEP